MDFEIGNSPISSQWYAVWTRSRHEKTSAAMLESLGVPHFLPLKSEVRKWSDRKQCVTVPMFRGYLFVHINPSKDSRLEVLKTPGISGFVGNQTGPLPIPDNQIEAIRVVLEKRVTCEVLPLLDQGDLVRVIRGPLVGVEGKLIWSNSSTSLTISIDMIHKSLLISISRDDVERVEPPASSHTLLQTKYNVPEIGSIELR